MTSRTAFLFSLLLGLMSGCATAPVPTVQRQGNVANPQATAGAAQTAPLAAEDDAGNGPQAQIRRGTGQVINRSVAASAPPTLSGASNGSATFNFEGESLQAVVKAILGDMLGQNYVIAPGVQGTVTLATPRAVSPAQALSLLEQVLSWNNARLVYADGRYNIVPADQALQGTVAPRSGEAGNARGYEVRVVPLRFIAADEMKKILEPYARSNAVIATDAIRNIITLSGSRSELENYLRTIQIFDVDWLSGMSVGVFPLQTGQASKVVADLEKVFGEGSKTPSAGMFRFMPLEGSNAVMVITSQAAYLDQIRDWLERIDNAGDTPRLFSYELKYIKARDLAQRLSEVFGAGGNRDAQTAETSLVPGSVGGALTSDPFASGSQGALNGSGTTGSSASFDSSGGLSSGSGDSSSNGLGSNGNSVQLSQRQEGNGAVTLEVEGSKVGVAAVEETNSLLVRASGNAWRSIRDVIDKLDVMPMQVHIEAQVAEVNLTGDLKYGVNWYFEQSVNAPLSGTPTSVIGNGAGLSSTTGRNSWSDIAGTVGGAGLGWTFLGKSAAAVISALDTVTNVRILQSPSVFVRNNALAQLKVGQQIPINSTSVNTGIGTNAAYTSVQYKDTGVILNVRPRVTKDGTVFMEIAQEVSTPGAAPANCDATVSSCNPPINTRFVKTEAAIQSGDTILLAGLINDRVEDGSAGVPFLSKLPVVGALFGQKTQATTRNEVIVLLTPTIVRNPQEARNLTDEYSQRFRAMEPLHPPKKK